MGAGSRPRRIVTWIAGAAILVGLLVVLLLPRGPRDPMPFDDPSGQARSALRAARYGTHFLPQGLKRRAYDPWVAALEADGRRPSDYRIGIIRSILVTDDRDTDWPVVRAAAESPLSFAPWSGAEVVWPAGVVNSRR